MRSAKSGPNLSQIWQVFGLWAGPHGSNRQMTMTVYNYRPRQFHRTSIQENPSSGYRDIGSASLAAARPPARPDRDDSPEGWGVKSLLDIGGTTIQDVGCLAAMGLAMEPDVHTMSDELMLQISCNIFLALNEYWWWDEANIYHIIQQLRHRFMCEIMIWSGDKTKLIHKKHFHKTSITSSKT